MEVVDQVTTYQTCIRACLEVPVKPLNNTIRLWMVRCGTKACGTKEGHEGSDLSCCHLSEVIVVGTPKRDTQPDSAMA